MNECVETLNRWGDIFWGFAWPMLWQSSLLMAVVFAFDLLCARRVRASVRYVLWMVVLVKLILPPSLALPTGATWWLWRPPSAVVIPAIQNYSVSFGDTTIPETYPSLPVSVAVPPERLSWDAWVLLTAAVMGMGLLLWLVFRWLRVAAAVRRAVIGPTEWEGILGEARQLAGLRRRPRLRLIDETQSPAVYGLWRPVILLPRMLANQISRHQLRAVLLHESMHLRRGDVWMNCAQTLLQIAYWWHPLLWLANARIRRVREEAVDDAVMLALRDGADAYAPTLLEVAKFAFRRPFASLGLVGILESRSALRQRVERLMDFRPPRRAGITFLSMCGIFAFCAVALPMGQGPAVGDNSPSSASSPKSKPALANVDYIHLSVSYHSEPLSAILNDLTKRSRELDPNQEGLHFSFRLQQFPFAAINPVTGLPVTNAVASEFENPTNVLISVTLSNVSLADVSDAICSAAKDHLWYAVEKDAVVFSPVPLYEMRTFKMNPKTFYSKLAKKIGYHGPPQHVSELIAKYFSRLGVKIAPPKSVFFDDGRGILFVYATPNDLDVIERVMLEMDDATGSERSADNPMPTNGNGISKEAELALDQALAVEHKEAHMDLTPQSRAHSSGTPYYLARGNLNADLSDPINGARISTASNSAAYDRDDLEQRTFSVSVAAFSEAVRAKTGETEPLKGFRELAAAAGVDLSPPKTLFLTYGAATLFVQASKSDMGPIQHIIDNLHCPPPHLHIKARFIELPRKFLSSDLVKSMFPGLTNGGVLPAPEFESFLREAKLQKGFEEVAEPEVTTLSGRQARLRTTILQPIVTGFGEDSAGATSGAAEPYDKFSDGSTDVPHTIKLETGPTFDVVAAALYDGRMVFLRVDASQIDFLGYAKTKGLAATVVTNAAGARVKLPRILPVVQTSRAFVNKIFYDGQTLVLFPQTETDMSYAADEKAKERISQAAARAREEKGDRVKMVLVTPTAMDEAGNRLYPKNDLRYDSTFLPVPMVTNWARTL
jgi:beta-lactamase regulating signal transducer with metallopeptidase domain